MKNWKKIGLGVVIIGIYAISQSNSQSLNNVSTNIAGPSQTQISTITPGTYQNNVSNEENTQIISPVDSKTSLGKNDEQPVVPQPQSITPTATYINSNGNTIRSPTYEDSAPDDATAKYRDGSYSFSQSHRGTCSHHGGVARWL